jgi:hypothetical protein
VITRNQSLVGMKFNKLTVVKLAGFNARRQRFWVCQCACGGKIERVNTAHLVSGHTKSCGCLSKFDEDMTGKKFHRLTVLRYLGRPPRGSGSWWECQCECGTVTNVTAPYLRFGHTKSCGCLQVEAIKATNARTLQAYPCGSQILPRSRHHSLPGMERQKDRIQDFHRTHRKASKRRLLHRPHQQRRRLQTRKCPMGQPRRATGKPAPGGFDIPIHHGGADCRQG